MSTGTMQMVGTRRMRNVAVALTLSGALVVGGCGTDPATSKTSDTAAPTASTSGAGSGTADPAPDGFQSVSPALGLTILLPAEVTASQSQMVDDRRHQVIYDIDDAVAPSTYIVEYDTPGGSTLEEISKTETESFAADGAPVQVTDTTVAGADSARTFSWTQTTSEPWALAEDAEEVQVACHAVIASASSGYVYSLYACGPAANQASQDQVKTVLASMEVSKP